MTTFFDILLLAAIIGGAAWTLYELRLVVRSVVTVKYHRTRRAEWRNL
jgi:hypothetical protein